MTANTAAATTVHERIVELKKQFRSMMNGVVSTSMREKGVDYRVNFGVEAPRLMQLAATLGKNHDLAQALWKENVRECRILAPMVQPCESFEADLADVWISTIRTAEEAQYLSMHLLQHLPYATAKIFEWMASESDACQLCGFYTAARLLQKEDGFDERAANEFLDQCASALRADNSAVSKAAYNALGKYSLAGEREAKAVQRILNDYAKSLK